MIWLPGRALSIMSVYFLVLHLGQAEKSAMTLRPEILYVTSGWVPSAMVNSARPNEYGLTYQ